MKQIKNIKKYIASLTLGDIVWQILTGQILEIGRQRLYFTRPLTAEERDRWGTMRFSMFVTELHRLNTPLLAGMDIESGEIYTAKGLKAFDYR